jgi:RNA polymerase sigma factor (sigma-70 family)
VGETDEYLVARVRAGDDAAFEAIYDRYARGVLAFCVHMLGSREAAEDALQLTFVSAFRVLRGGTSGVSLRPWLYTIARNRCLSELRTRRGGVDVDEVATDRPFFEGVADEVQRREELREMLEDMQRLPADQRAALVLFELGDHSHKEIAAVLGVRREKVKALIFQAREALVRARNARDRPCVEIRERLATLHRRVLPRSVTRAHIDRCPSCAAFEGEVRRQRAALALILPVPLAGALKASVLGSVLHGGGAAAAGVGACGSGGAAAGAGACGTGAVITGGATTAGGAGGAGAVAVSAGAAGSLAGTGAASTAVVAGAPVAAAATGLTAVGEYAASVGAGGLGATGVVAKILTAAAIATGAAAASHASSRAPHPLPGPVIALQIRTTSASPATAPTIALTPVAATTPAAAPSSADTTDSTTATAPSSAGTAATTTPTTTPNPANTTASTTPTTTPNPANTTTDATATASALGDPGTAAP